MLNMDSQSSIQSFLLTCLSNSLPGIREKRSDTLCASHIVLTFVTAVAVSLYSKASQASKNMAISSKDNQAFYDLGEGSHAKIVEQGEYGSAKIVNNKIVYTPEGKPQSDQIKISITKADGKTEIIELDISVGILGSTMMMAGGVALAAVAGVVGVSQMGGGDDNASHNYVPAITSSDTVSVAEGSTQVLTVIATDPESDPITFSIQGGEDAAKFQIDANTGALTFINPPDYDGQNSFDGDDAYEVTIGATDGSLTTTQALTVNVTNLPVVTTDVPMASLQSLTITGLSANDELVSHGDVNNDGFDDLIFFDDSNGANKVVTIVHGKNFSASDTDLSDYTTTTLSYFNFDKVSTVDIDGDQKTDIIGYNNDGSMSIVLGSEIVPGTNYGAFPGGFSTIDLVGMQTNSDVIGHSNFNSDQYQDIFFYDSGTNALNILYGAASPGYTSFTITGLPAGVDVISMDVNNDNIDDFLFFDSALNQVSYIFGSDAYVGMGSIAYNMIVDGTLSSLPANYNSSGHIESLGGSYSGFFIEGNPADNELKVVLSDSSFASHNTWGDLDILSIISNFAANENIKGTAEFNGNGYFELITQDSANGNITLYYQFEDFFGF